MTIKDLARESGYSLGTVSRVLNNQPNVSEKARTAILAIAERHGFELNQSAQSLKQQRSNAVLIIVKGTANEMFASMVEQLQSLFSRTTHPLIVDFIDEDDNEVLRAVKLCRERKPMGVMFLGGTNCNFEADFDKITVPAVVVTNDASALAFENLSSVTTNDLQGAACAVDYLIHCGHRNIAVLGGGLVGCETALYLAMYLHKNVTLIEMSRGVAMEDYSIPRQALIEHLNEYVTCYCGVKCTGITPEGMEVSDSYGNHAVLPADTVVLAAGMRARAKQAEEFRGLSLFFEPVGDCVVAKNVRGATRSGYDAASRI